MKKIWMTALLITLNIIAIICLINYRSEESEMIESKITNDSNEVSIMIQSSAGSTTYNRSTSETWPDSTKYHLNNVKSYCKNGSTYSLSGSKVLVNLNRADDCYFYFDLGADVTFSMQLFQNNYGAPKPDLYTNGDYMAVINFPSNKNISTVCVTNESNSSNCTWKSISGATTSGTTSSLKLTKPIALSSGEGLKTLYAYVKDSSNNIYGYQSVSITVDTTPPTCSINVSSSGITYSASDNYFVYSKNFFKDGTSISGTSTSLAVGKYEGGVTDGIGHGYSCGADVKKKEDKYLITINACNNISSRKEYTGATSVGVCPPGYSLSGSLTSCAKDVPYCVDNSYSQSTSYADNCNVNPCGNSLFCSVVSCTKSAAVCPSGYYEVSGNTTYCYKNLYQ